MEKYKFPRTWHVPWSSGTDDDKTWSEEDFRSAFELRDLVITEKMDGENTTAYSDGSWHARSIDSNNKHKARECMNRYKAQFMAIPKGWRVCGENLFWKHSIHYKDLTDFFQVFSVINDGNQVLSWTDTEYFCGFYGFKTVKCKETYNGYITTFEEIMKDLMWESKTTEGLVIRPSNSFYFDSYSDLVAKYVRPNHVQTDEHWLNSKLTPNEKK